MTTMVGSVTPIVAYRAVRDPDRQARFGVASIAAIVGFTQHNLERKEIYDTCGDPGCCDGMWEECYDAEGNRVQLDSHGTVDLAPDLFELKCRVADLATEGLGVVDRKMKELAERRAEYERVLALVRTR